MVERAAHGGSLRWRTRARGSALVDNGKVEVEKKRERETGL